MADSEKELTEWNARNAWIEYRLVARPTDEERETAGAEFDVWLLARDVATRKEVFDLIRP